MSQDIKTKEPLRELHLFAGAGGGILGGLLLGHRPVCAVEIEPYCRDVLLQRQRDGLLPRFPIWDDVRTFDGRYWRGRVDVVCGGFPCQDISVAGKGAGLDGERSGLWSEMRRIIGEVGPRYVFVENSPMLTLRGLDRVLGDLASMGFDAEWGVLGACDAGADHARERIWVLADADRSGRERKRENVASLRGSWRVGELEGLLEREVRSGVPAGSRGRVSDGVAHRMDRLSALGNGQVPAVAALAWRTLTEALP